MKKAGGIVSIVFIIICIAYIVYDIATGRSDIKEAEPLASSVESYETHWSIIHEINIDFGQLTSVSLTDDNRMICAGESFLAGYDNDFSQSWLTALDETIHALTVSGDTIYAATGEKILLFNQSGVFIEEWGPYDDGAIITSLAANKRYIIFADAGNKLVFVLNKRGALKSIIGYPDKPFIIPSPYFDVAISDNDTLMIANPGKRNIEFRTIEGKLIRSIGEEGSTLEYFCGCCNPSHFTLSPDGNIITAEKGINRIKIIYQDGRLLEPVSGPEGFIASSPLDVSVDMHNRIYAANRYNSTVYIFKRIDINE